MAFALTRFQLKGIPDTKVGWFSSIDALCNRAQVARMWAPNLDIPEIKKVYEDGLQYQITRLEGFEAVEPRINLTEVPLDL